MSSTTRGLRHLVGASASWARRPAARRSGWVVLDQGVSSLTNFAATIVVARSVSDQLFGAFSVAVVVYIVLVNLTRALVSQPLAIRVSAVVDQRGDVAAALGAAIFVGGAAGVGVVIAGMGVGTMVGAALAVVGALLPGLMLQDTLRFCLFTMGRPTLAVVNDLVWAASQAGLLAVVLTLRHESTVALTAAWAGGAVVASVVGLRQARTIPAVGEGLRFVRRHLSLGGRMAAEAIMTNGSSQVTILAVGATLGATGVGGIRGGATLFGPFTVAFLGLMAAGIAEGSRLFARSPDRLIPVLAAVSCVLLGLSVVWGTVLVLMPSEWGRVLLGDTWPAAQDLIVPFSVSTAGAGLASGGFLGLRVLAAVSATLRLRIITGAATIVTGVAGAIAWGPRGAVAGLAVGTWANALGAWWSLARYRSLHPSVFAGGGAQAHRTPTAGTAVSEMYAGTWPPGVDA
jgi:O-antigen/teichoic acid export membrane protein